MKTSLLKLYTFIAILYTLSACTVQEEIYFNKDFSGKFSYSLDLANLKSTMASMQSTFGDSLKSETDEMNFPPEMKESFKNQEKMKEFTEIAGISNFKTDITDAGLISMSFDFKDIESLNKAYNKLASKNDVNNMFGMGDQNTGGGFMPGIPPNEDANKENTTNQKKEDFNYFVRKGNTITFKKPRKQVGETEMNGMNEQMEMFKGMGEVFTYQTKLTFDKKVKKIKAKNVENYSDANSVTIKMTTKDLTSNLPNPEIIIQLK